MLSEEKRISVENILKGIRYDLKQTIARNKVINNIDLQFPGDEALHLEIMDFIRASYSHVR